MADRAVQSVAETVLSASTTTWLVCGFTDQAVPVTVGAALSAAAAVASWSELRVTLFAVAPASSTVLAAASVVTATTVLPSSPIQLPAVLSPPSWLTSVPASVAASGVGAGEDDWLANAPATTAPAQTSPPAVAKMPILRTLRCLA